jgi:hypothetical protein
VSWRFEEIEHDCPRMHSPFQPHHHQRQHLYEWESGTRDAKGVSELGETWGKCEGRGWQVRRLAFNGLHSVNGLSTHDTRGWGRLEDSFRNSKKLGSGTDERGGGPGERWTVKVKRVG